MPLKGEIFLCINCNKDWENNYYFKHSKEQREKDNQRIFGTKKPTITQLRNLYFFIDWPRELKEGSISEKDLKTLVNSQPYFFNNLVKLHNSSSDSAAGKVWKVFINHGIPLEKYYNYWENYQEKKIQQSEFTRRRIEKNVSDWRIDSYV